MNTKRKLLLSGLIAAGLIGFGVLANWYVVYVWAAQMLAIKEAPNPYQELYDELLRPSVKVTTPQGSGSGVVIASTDKATHILTAAHVVGDYAEVTVEFYHTPLNPLLLEGTCGEKSPLERGRGVLSLDASVVITDTAKDLALLKITTDKPYPYVAKLAPRNYRPYIFTPVWVIGASLGFPPRPSEGIITAITHHKDTKDTKNSLCSLCLSGENYFWEVSAPIWPGNSGGGVFLKDTHELIGIAVWVRVYRGQLATTMGGVVKLANIYEFLEGNDYGFIIEHRLQAPISDRPPTGRVGAGGSYIPL